MRTSASVVASYSLGEADLLRRAGERAQFGDLGEDRPGFQVGQSDHGAITPFLETMVFYRFYSKPNPAGLSFPHRLTHKETPT